MSWGNNKTIVSLLGILTEQIRSRKVGAARVAWVAPKLPLDVDESVGGEDRIRHGLDWKRGLEGTLYASVELGMATGRNDSGLNKVAGSAIDNDFGGRMDVLVERPR